MILPLQDGQTAGRATSPANRGSGMMLFSLSEHRHPERTMDYRNLGLHGACWRLPDVRGCSRVNSRHEPALLPSLDLNRRRGDTSGCVIANECSSSRQRPAPDMKRLAILGNHLPRQCGIATFTTHLADALTTAAPDVDSFVLAMNDAGRRHTYPFRVRFEIAKGDLGSYERAADYLNVNQVDVLAVQHEYARGRWRCHQPVLRGGGHLRRDGDRQRRATPRLAGSAWFSGRA